MSKKPNKLPVEKPLDAEQIAKEKIPASMFEQVAGEKIYDQQIEGEAIGFFKDAYLRFKKNKAALGAMWIILCSDAQSLPLQRTAYQLWYPSTAHPGAGKLWHRRRMCHHGHL